ncbi:MAG: carbon-nitrogen family hydrolase [Deltaproteobacteria bacterium]|nr:carbon-nitrogen family hydrolase [Deltaproteobacteria bacterium]
MRFKAACVQFDVKKEELEKNLAFVISSLQKLSKEKVKLVVLPELWAAKFDKEKSEKLWDFSQAALNEVAPLSKKYEMVIVGSLIEKEGNNYFNTAYVTDASGNVIARYRKVHLFSMAGEDTYFKSGREKVVVGTEVGKLGVIICYDLRFPELARELALDGAEILAVPAQWPKARVKHWRTLALARAIENQFFVVACNRTGWDKEEEYPGHSLLIDPWGEALAEGGEDDGFIIAEIDLERIKIVRHSMKCFEDRTPHVY